MNWLSQLFRRRQREVELDAELRFHLEEQIKDNLAQGMKPEEARRCALLEFGGVEQVKEECRDQRQWVWLELWLKDLQFSVRSLRKTPSFTAIVILTLALGIGANTALFSIIDALILRAMPVKEPGGLVLLSAAGPVIPNREFPYALFNHEGNNNAFPFSFYELFRDQSKTLSDVVAVGGWPMQRPMVASGFGSRDIETVAVEEVSGNYFSALGVEAAIGRTLDPSDDKVGNTEPVVVISYDLWQHRFGGDPSVVGKTLRFDTVTVTIVGVLARGFNGAQVGFRTGIWFPIQLGTVMDANQPWGTQAMKSPWPWIHILGRLKNDVSRTQAMAELDQLYQGKLADLDPRRKSLSKSDEGSNLLHQRLELTAAGTGYAGFRPIYQRPISVLMMLVGIIQLVACANVAGLLLARGAARQRELALRTALGASRSRLVVQLLTESLLLAALAGALGLTLAMVGTRYLGTYVNDIELGVSWRVLAFAFTATTTTGIVFGLLPALRLSGREMTSSIKDQNVAGRQRLNSVLVIAQIGFAFLVVTIAGLFVRTLQNLATVEIGIQRQHLQLFDLNVSPGIKPEARAMLYHRLLETMETEPGVKNATAYLGLDLLGEMAIVERFSVAGYVPAKNEVLEAAEAIVGPHFFETMGIPLVRGRDFGSRDEAVMAHGVPAIIISEWSAKKLFGAADPIGRRINLGTDLEIVGIAKDVKYGSLREAPRFVFYIPLAVRPEAFRMTFAIRSEGGAMITAQSLRSMVQKLDDQAQISGIRTIDQRLDAALSSERLTAHLAGAFGISALILSGMGLFGLMSYNVAGRTREIGIRMALGAPVGEILVLIVRRGIVLGLLGCAVGIIAASVCTRFVASLLYGVQSLDLLSFTGAAILLLLATLLACVLPARRAATVDPLVALRAD